METDDKILRRLMDLARRAHERGIVTYSDFLSNGEISTYYNNQRQFDFVRVEMFGGFSDAERQVLAFFPKTEWGYESSYPISCLEITPTHKKFAEALSHRDYLGAILNLGIERTMLGDILVTDEKAYLFCKNSIASFIMDECTRIRHTSVLVSQVDWNDTAYEQQFEEITGTVSSLRIDSILAVCTKLSRSKCCDLIRGEKVFCNHKLVISPHFIPSNDDIISIRGTGKFIFCESETRVTKKGRRFIKLLKYK